MSVTLVSTNSQLARICFKEIKRLFNNIEFNLLGTSSTQEDDAFFSSKMGEAIISGEADIAIQVAQNLPYPFPKDLDVFALLKITNSTEDEWNNLQPDFLVVIGKQGKTELKNLFSPLDDRKNWGKTDIVGIGPGDYNLVTVRGLKLMQEADILLYDDLIDEDYLQQFNAEKFYVGKRKGSHSFQQEAINELIYQAAISGKQVVRLKGGDPLLFGRGAEEFHYLKRRFVEAEITPGISSAFAAASQHVIPLTDRDLASSVTFLSGHNIDKLKIPKSDTLVFYMGASNQQAIAQKLIAEGRSKTTPVAIVKDASYAHSQSIRLTLGELAQKATELGSPAIIFVGEVASPTKGVNTRKRWLYTGTQVDDEQVDGIIFHSPLITIIPEETNSEISEAFANLSAFDRILFTSKYAVQNFFKHLYNNNLDVRSIALISITVIGKSTSEELKKNGLYIASISDEENSDGSANYFKANKIKKERILIPRSNIGVSTLSDTLRELNNEVIDLQIYRNIMPEAVVKHDLSNFEGIIFTSPSTVTNFVRLYGSIPPHLKLMCKSIETQKRLDRLMIK